MDGDKNDIHQRLLHLENEIKNLKMKKPDTVNEETDTVNEEPDLPDKKNKKEKKEKKPRTPTEYNKFVSSYINEQKDILGTEFNHKVAFSNAAKEWKSKKETKN